MRNILIIISILAVVVFADIPRTINYQGKITDPGGVAIDGATNVEFRLFDVASGGAALWSESHTGVSVVKGLFDVVLGETTPFPAGLSFTEPYWVEIVVESEVLSPRQPLSSVPYAMRAGAIDTGTVIINVAAGYGLWGTTDTVNVGASYGIGISDDSIWIDTTEIDSRYVNELQPNAIISGMILDNEIAWNDLTTAVQESILAGSGGSGDDWGRPSIADSLYEGATPLIDRYYYWNSSWSGTGKGLILTSSDYFGGEFHTGLLLGSGAVGYNDVSGALGRFGAGYYGIYGETPIGSSSGGYGGCFLSTAAADGIGALGLGNNITVYNIPIGGCGLVGAGLTSAVYGQEQTGAGTGYLGYYGTTVVGHPMISTGVYGRGGLDVGAVGSANNNDGVRGLTTCTIAGVAGVYGAAYNTDAEKYGVFGETEGIDAAGVYGYGGSFSNGVAGECVSLATYAGVLGINLVGYGVFANGDIGASGFKAATISTSRGWERLYAMESPDVEFVASGTAKLAGGEAIVEFERLFVEAISPEIPIKITVSPSGECRQLYVSERSAQGFVVRESFDGSSDVEFDWIAIGRRLGYENRPDDSQLNEFMQNVEDFGARLDRTTGPTGMENESTKTTLSDLE